MFERKNEAFKESKRKKALAAVMAGLLLIAIRTAESIGTRIVRQKNIYMLYYQEEIAVFSSKYGLDPFLVSSMIFCESTFKADAVSSVGARGLMQIMPETGIWLAGKLGVKDFDASMLFRPSLNIEMGCYYMNFLSERYGGNARNAVAAYHSGQGRVDGWLKDPSISPDGVNLENVPEGETQRYIERVFAVYDVYKKVHKDAFGEPV